MLSASGYVVARRKAVVSAKIQGRLSWLGVEEGSVVREGQVFARLESTDYEANVQRAKAAVQRAEADLGESQRQLRLAEDLTRQKIMGTDQRDATASRVRLAEASLAQARADVAFYEAQLANTQIRAPFSGVVVKKMAEVGESVAPIPPGVNISTASGAIVALADLATLEVEVDVSESNVAKLGATPAGRGHGGGIPRPAVQGGAAPGHPHRRPHQGHGAGEGHDPRQGQGPEARDERQGHLPRAREDEGARPTQAPVRVVTVPKDAVVTRDGKSVVFELVQGKAKARPVSVAGERQGEMVVREGLAGGEMLVRRPPETLKDGDSVRVKP